jgi:hypothetical protein
MSAYRDFTSDFPTRCLEVLAHQMAWAKFKGRDVTLLLMVSSAAFLVPYERLRLDTKHPPHPSGDGERFAALAESLVDLMAEKFCGSNLCPEMTNSWKVAKDVPSVQGDLDVWYPPKTLKPVSRDKSVSSMLALIRNALAHGNIFTTGSPIESLIFVQRRGGDHGGSSKFEVLSVSPADFGHFIREWVAFLRTSNLTELYLVA